MSNRFVLLSAARSGTSLIIEALATHPQILAHGEIFHAISEWHVRPEYLNAFGVVRRETDPVGFANDVLDHDFGRDAVGFKMWRDQNPAACDAVLRNPSIIKLILHRENRLAHLSSCMLAEQTSIWNVRSNESLDPSLRQQKVWFSEQTLAEFNFWHDNLFDYYRANAAGPVVELSYADACAMRFDPVFERLGVSQRSLSPSTLKLYGDDILQRFHEQGHDRIRKYLAEIGKSEWLYEKLD